MFNNDYFYGSYVDIGIDKITLGIESTHLNYKSTPIELKGIIDIITFGGWSELNIQLEYNGVSHIDKYNPWYSVLMALKHGISFGLFTEKIASYLNNCIDSIFHGCFNPYSFITNCFPYPERLFKLDEYELYFDFYGYDPILQLKEDDFLCYLNTFYSKDYKKKLRRKDEHNYEVKGIRRSLLAIYDRGLKINSQERIKRIEFRICDDRAKTMLSPYVIFMPVNYFILTHYQQIKQTLNRYLSPNSINFNDEYISQNAPTLRYLL